MLELTVSLVLFHNDREQIMKAIESSLSSRLQVKLYLVDNSSNDELRNCATDSRIEYIYNNRNIGFGSAHNIAIRKAKGTALYHLILNPDVYFEGYVLEDAYSFMEFHKNIGQLSVRTLYPNGDIQRLCKLLPTPFDLIARRFIPGFLLPVFKKRLDAYELKHKSYDEIMNVPNLSGSFMFIRASILDIVSGFDEKIFLYTEDLDLTRRIHQHADTIYNPGIQIYHEFAKGSYFSRKLMIYHIRSAIYYFNKWGWFFDKERVRINNQLK